MDLYFLILRVLHVGLGVFWAGTIFFFAMFFLPSIADMGPEGGKVMGALQKHRYADRMPIIAGVTVLSGLLLYHRVSGGFDPVYMKSVHGMGYGVGGGAAIVALIFGMIVLRPAAGRMGQLMQAMPSLPDGAERDARMAEVQNLRRRAAAGTKLVTVLLLVAVIFMAITRYL